MTSTKESSEQVLRTRLANCYHLIDYMGWTETIFNHVSLRLPGTQSYLVNPFGLNYTEVTPDNLLIVDVNGKKLSDSPHDANPAGFALHGAVHAARDDIHCMIHTHTNEISAVAQKEDGFDCNNFYGAQLFGRIGYHAFEGITLFDAEKERMLASLGDKHILVLRNHGIAVGESSLEKTFFLLWTVQRAAEIQYHSAAMGGRDTPLSDTVRQRCADLTQDLIKGSGFADKFFAAMLRKMKEETGRGFGDLAPGT